MISVFALGAMTFYIGRACEEGRMSYNHSTLLSTTKSGVRFNSQLIGTNEVVVDSLMGTQNGGVEKIGLERVLRVKMTQTIEHSPPLEVIHLKESRKWINQVSSNEHTCLWLYVYLLTTA